MKVGVSIQVLAAVLLVRAAATPVAAAAPAAAEPAAAEPAAAEPAMAEPAAAEPAAEVEGVAAAADCRNCASVRYCTGTHGRGTCNTQQWGYPGGCRNVPARFNDRIRSVKNQRLRPYNPQSYGCAYYKHANCQGPYTSVNTSADLAHTGWGDTISSINCVPTS